MGQNRKQHYVPEYYLRRFAHDGRQVWVFDKKTGKSFSASVRDIAQDAYFYTIPSDAPVHANTNRNFYESTLCYYEGIHKEASEVVVGLMEDEVVPESVRTKVAHMVLVQYARTVAARADAVAVNRGAIQALVEQLLPLNFPDYNGPLPKVLVNETASGLELLNRVLGGESAATLTWTLARRYWTVWTTGPDGYFVTSDNPIALTRANPKMGLDGLAPLADDAIIAYPLSPTHLLEIRATPPQVMTRDGLVRQASADRITAFNALQIAWSDRRAYSYANNFQFAEEMCKANPELSEGKPTVLVVHHAQNAEEGTIWAEVQARAKPNAHQ